MRHAEPQAVRSDFWSWRECVSTEWSTAGEHINCLEARAYVLALRWRLRSAKNVYTKFMHLVDSQVVQSAMAEGRSHSRRLGPIVRKAAALRLGGCCYPILMYVRTRDNPADRPSRRFRTKPTDSLTKRSPGPASRERALP